MHRSGTSAITGALREFGFELGPDLMAAAPDNPKGFWEHAGVVAIHETLLSSLGRTWDDPRPMPEGWLKSEAAGQARRELGALLDRDFSGTPRWAIKDPRLSRLLPLWLPLLEKRGVGARVVLVLRHPDEVAGSLKARNKLPAGLSELLWIQYLVDAEENSRSLPRTVLAYEDVLEDPGPALRGALSRVGFDPAPDDGQVDARLREFVSPSDRHHVATQGGKSTRLAVALFEAARSGDAPWEPIRALATRFHDA